MKAIRGRNLQIVQDELELIVKADGIPADCFESVCLAHLASWHFGVLEEIDRILEKNGARVALDGLSEFLKRRNEWCSEYPDLDERVSRICVMGSDILKFLVYV